jgi:hypothetical protein
MLDWRRMNLNRKLTTDDKNTRFTLRRRGQRCG